MPKYNHMPSRNEKAPPISSRWQEQLTSLLGLTPDGRPKLRLVWGQESEWFYWEKNRLRYIRSKQPKFVGWEESEVTEGEVKVLTLHPPTITKPTVPPSHYLRPLAVWEHIGIDRWFIEQWQGPRTAGNDPVWWEKEFRYQWWYDPTMGVNRKVDVYGPFPVHGAYARSPKSYPWMISRHDEGQRCCADRDKEGYICLGEYRAPEQRDIDFIASLVRQAESEPVLSGYDETAPASVVAQDTRDDFHKEAVAACKANDELDFRRAALRRHIDRSAVHFDIQRRDS